MEDSSVPESQLALTAEDYLVGEGEAWVLDGRAGDAFHAITPSLGAC